MSCAATVTGSTTHFHDPIAERTSTQYRARVYDHEGNLIDPTSITAAYVRLQDHNGQDINSRTGLIDEYGDEILVDADSWLTFVLTPSDTVAVGTDEFQSRTMTFRVVFTNGQFHKQVTFTLHNLSGVS